MNSLERTTIVRHCPRSHGKRTGKVIENKFYCPSRFAQEIEVLVRDNKEMNYIDAIVFFCEHNNIDIESVPKLISKPLKEKIKYEAIELNFLKRTGCQIGL